ncbi:Hypothetical protein FKW44_017585 [Caligus rogercresseyi]|uniref:Uncharacterized protein n=1 Tax=Caligus rogercresseyi TaxID=217165 RepID=A0A7T8GT92_CALRO|nr:Hypothetical protein FKW44_017585 [Caligus rogercresseyi]
MRALAVTTRLDIDISETFGIALTRELTSLGSPGTKARRIVSGSFSIPAIFASLR